MIFLKKILRIIITLFIKLINLIIRCKHKSKMKHTMTSKCNKKSLKKSSSKNMWCTNEEVSLRKAILKYGKGKWLKMKQDSLFNVVFKDRTPSDLKDKWRNIERKEKKVKQKAKKNKKNKNEIKVDDIIPETDNIVPTFTSESVSYTHLTLPTILLV